MKVSRQRECNKNGDDKPAVMQADLNPGNTPEFYLGMHYR